MAWKEMKNSSDVWRNKMLQNHRHIPSFPTYIYDLGVKEHLHRINTTKDIKIVKMMKKWNTIRMINILRILSADIKNPILLEAYIRNPS
jgi:hypothetical protein